ncbi:HpcH/HpaI aldolase family protein [Amycolatopsis viridis]|uniref:4-hydroxy-2-oxoheptanedioate aldolase n=1 Tax=Amycolatopsis viridis TaxID=185678 RepID=A0ABX0SQ63_9PSEU|nr:aldolase/citrate lyase family protein [Amycolatopsis viridis]NIH79096.1 4-hydroxy-2-oxoheptanedioate aldolase [Amycolatopsis viridis]
MARRTKLATFALLDATEVVELIALAGFDTVILDAEHGPLGLPQLAQLVVAARSRDLPALVRVASNDAQAIGAALDLGADGVLVPQIASLADAERAVAAARFAPAGHRGANPFVRAAGFAGSPEWFANANKSTEVHLMIEGEAGLDALDAILATSRCDGIFVGPVDLSHALGVPGELDHPTVVEAAAGIIAAAQAAGVSAGVFATEIEAARRWAARGADMVALGTDTHWTLRGFQTAVTAFTRT